jgi:hypothetical protein
MSNKEIKERLYPLWGGGQESARSAAYVGGRVWDENTG